MPSELTLIHATLAPPGMPPGQAEKFVAELRDVSWQYLAAGEEAPAMIPETAMQRKARSSGQQLEPAVQLR